MISDSGLLFLSTLYINHHKYGVIGIGVTVTSNCLLSRVYGGY